MNRITPNGGVMAPMIRFRLMTMPKCTGSMPYFWMIGTRSTTGTSTNRLQWGLEKLGVTIDQLKLGGTTLGGTGKDGAQIRIDGIDNGSINFSDGSLLTPRQLKGRITSGSIRNLSVDLGESE